MTTNQLLFELAALACVCNVATFTAQDRAEGTDVCDPCLAKKLLSELEGVYRLGGRGFGHERARVACEISADQIAARDSDELTIPDCEDES